MKKLMTTMSALSLIPLFSVIAEAGHGYHRGGGGKTYLLALVALAVGYWVLTLAVNQKGKLKKLGNWIGGGIIVISLLGLICTATYKIKKCYHDCKKGECSTKLCPFKGAHGGGAKEHPGKPA